MMLESLVLQSAQLPMVLMGTEQNSLDISSLYRRFGPAVFRRAKSLLGNEDEAMEVLQETFLAFVKQQQQFRKEASPFTFLYQIATYQSLDRIRKKARWKGQLNLVIESENPEEIQEVAPLTAPSEGLSQVEAAFDLALLTKGETPEVMTAAMLYFVEGYTTEEIGKTMDLSRKTVGKMLAQFAERAQKRSARLSSEQDNV